MANQLVSGAYGLEIIVSPGQKTIYFPDVAVLRGKRIKHIDLCDELFRSKSGLQIPDIENQEVEGNITFRSAQSQINIVDKLNIREISTYSRQGNRISFNHIFDFSKSYINLTKNTVDKNKALYFVVWYDEPAVRHTNVKSDFEIQFFEVQLKQSRTMFNEENKLRGKRLKNLLLSFPSVTPSGYAGISENSSKRMFLTLQKGNLQFFQGVPLSLFYQYKLYEQLKLENITFDFTNSFIDIVDPVDPTDYKSVFFNVMIES